MWNIKADLGQFKTYAEARRQFMTHVGCEGSCRDPLAEFSEWIVNEQLPRLVACTGPLLFPRRAKLSAIQSLAECRITGYRDNVKLSQLHHRQCQP